MTMAVEDSTKPIPATKATSGGPASQHAGAGQQRAADGDLRDAEPEDLPPQAPQPRRLHLQPDHEQEHHHAEFGDVQDGLRIGEPAQAERTDDEAGRQIAQHGAEPEPLEHRHRDDGGPEQGHHLRQFDARMRFRRRHCPRPPLRRRRQPSGS